MDDGEREKLAERVVQMMSSMIGPTGDMIRAQMAAEVDGLIDARRRFVRAGWPDWMINQAMVSLMGGETESIGRRRKRGLR